MRLVSLICFQASQCLLCERRSRDKNVKLIASRILSLLILMAIKKSIAITAFRINRHVNCSKYAVVVVC